MYAEEDGMQMNETKCPKIQGRSRTPDRMRKMLAVETRDWGQLWKRV